MNFCPICHLLRELSNPHDMMVDLLILPYSSVNLCFIVKAQLLGKYILNCYIFTNEISTIMEWFSFFLIRLNPKVFLSCNDFNNFG